MNKRERFAEGFNTREVLLILLATTLLFLMVVGLEISIIIDQKILLHAPNGKISLQLKNKDQLILEDIHNQCDSDYYISYESKIYKCYNELPYQYL